MKTLTEIKLDHITTALASHRAAERPVNERGHAAVALLLREKDDSAEVLFIIRALHDLDPWSGNIGFPGGRLNHGGETPQQAAERETREELSLDLEQARYLGRLDDLYGAIMPVLVSCFVYRLHDTVALRPNHEIDTTFWCPLTRLLEPGRHQQRTFFYRGEERCHPTVELLEPEQPVLWGITYRLMRNFFSLCGYEFGIGEK
jgi:8-oxo-dGTP pyrophosphatase MutT (NUDIX family)